MPLDYSKPDGATIKLALNRRRASSGKPVTTLLVNPGGPGGSGLELVENASLQFPRRLLQTFDIVGWDPRGTGKSAPVRCTPKLDPVFHLDYSPDTPAEVDALAARTKQLVASCVKNSGKLLPHVSSLNTAQDMDRIRAALGEDELTYLGYSYGTLLGALYAEKFPTRVRALVLDGAVDPSLTVEQMNAEQSAGLETALQRFFEHCAGDRSCAFSNGGHPDRAFDAVARRVDRRPIAAGGGRTLGPGEFDIGVVTPLYEGVEGWDALAPALAAAQRGDGRSLMMFSDAYTGRKNSGRYDNSQPAYWAISCLDSPSPRGAAAFEALAARVAAKAPHFGASTANLGLACAFWPYPAVMQPGPIHAPGAPPILVVGTLDDPITPVAGARSLASQLESGHLLLTEGEGHSAFGRLNSCVDNHVIDYLATLKLPPEGTVCH
ncbi:MAG: alpha/beta hydrolase [Acidimicrobiia bacterium]